MTCIGHYGKNENIVRAKSFDESWRSFYEISSYYERLFHRLGRENQLSDRWGNIDRMRDVIRFLRDECESVNGGIRYNYKFDSINLDDSKLIDPSASDDSKEWMVSIKFDLNDFNYLSPLPTELKSFYGKTKGYIVHVFVDIDGRYVLNMWDKSELNQNGYFVRKNGWDQSPNVIVDGSYHGGSMVFKKDRVIYEVSTRSEGKEFLIKKSGNIIRENFISYRHY